MSILLLETVHPDAERLLAGAGEVKLAASPTEPGPAVATDGVQAIVTRGRGQVTAALIQRCPRLRVIARCGVGLDNVDLAAAARAGIPVVYTPGANAATVAEHTLALILALVRGIAPMAGAVAAGRWSLRDGYAGDEVAGKTLGVIGLGAIGRRVATLGAALGMEVMVAAHGSTEPGVAVLPLPDLLPRADVITLHVPLTERTRGLIDGRALARFKPGAFLVNTARGALIDETAVAGALAEGRLAGFAADVLAEEPPAPSHPLLAEPRALITPHVASLTAGTYRAMCVRACRNVAAILRGEAPERDSVHAPPTGKI